MVNLYAKTLQFTGISCVLDQSPNVGKRQLRRESLESLQANPQKFPFRGDFRRRQISIALRGRVGSVSIGFRPYCCGAGTYEWGELCSRPKNQGYSLAALAEPLDNVVEEERLTEIPVIGDAIADIVTKLHNTGTHPSLEKLRKEVPAGVLELLTIPGLRPDKVMRLYKDLGISSVAELEASAKDDRIRKAKGLGAALQAKILQNLAIARTGAGKLHIHRAAALLRHAVETLQAVARPKLKRITIAGDFRRGCELVGDLSIVAEALASDAIPDASAQGGLHVHLTDRKHFGATLLFATGSDAHLKCLRGLAATKGMSLDRAGCTRAAA